MPPGHRAHGHRDDHDNCQDYDNRDTDHDGGHGGQCSRMSTYIIPQADLVLVREGATGMVSVGLVSLRGLDCQGRLVALQFR